MYYIYIYIYIYIIQIYIIIMCIFLKRLLNNNTIMHTCMQCNSNREKSIHSLLQSEAPTINFKSSTWKLINTLYFTFLLINRSWQQDNTSLTCIVAVRIYVSSFTLHSSHYWWTLFYLCMCAIRCFYTFQLQWTAWGCRTPD